MIVNMEMRPGTTVNMQLVQYDNEIQQEEFYVRACYPTLAAKILELAQSGTRTILITGTPGIGKSFFRNYMLWHLLRDGKDVLMQSTRRYGASGFALVYSHGIPSVVKKGRICGDPSGIVYNLADLSDNAGDFVIRRQMVTIATASPNNDLGQVAKQSFVKLYMPAWDLAELQQAAVEMKWEQVAEGFLKYGGVPRAIAYPDSFVSRVHDKVEGLVATHGSEALKHLSGDSIASHTITHFIVDPKEFCVVGHQIASNYIDKLVRDKAVNLMLRDVNGLDIWGSLGLERTAHSVLNNADTDFPIKCLSGTDVFQGLERLGPCKGDWCCFSNEEDGAVLKSLSPRGLVYARPYDHQVSSRGRIHRGRAPGENTENSPGSDVQ